MKKWIFVLAFLAAPLAAQDQDLGQPAPEGGQVETTGTEASGEDAEGGLVFTVTDESDWADLSIAIPGFAADRDVDACQFARHRCTWRRDRKCDHCEPAEQRPVPTHRPGALASARLRADHRPRVGQLARARRGNAGTWLCPRPC